MTLIFFNLLVNATFSLAVGLLVVGFFLWLFRIETGPWRVFFLSLPFCKILYDSVRGLPADSILYSSVDPFSLPPHHQYLKIGVGMSSWGPMFRTSFSVRDTEGNRYASSIGDYLAIWIQREFGASVPFTLVSLVCGVAAVFVLFRIFHACKFEIFRRGDRKHATLLRQVPISLYRTVDIYISKGFSGTPFTGGLLKPYICVPQDAFQKLSQAELEAVLFHELAHIHRFDLLGTMFVQILGDIFWFVPGYRWLSKKIDGLREIVADQWAVKRGVLPELLASALIKLREIPEHSSRFILYSAFFRRKSLLKTRVERLLGEVKEKPARFGWRLPIVKIVAVFWTFMAVMLATLGGNHPPQARPIPPIPQWISEILQSLGVV